MELDCSASLDPLEYNAIKASRDRQKQEEAMEVQNSRSQYRNASSCQMSFWMCSSSIPFSPSMQPVWKGYKMSNQEMEEQLCWNFFFLYFCALTVVPFY